MQLVRLFLTATAGGLVAFVLGGLLVASAMMLAWHYAPQPVPQSIQQHPASKPEMPTPPPMRAGVN